MVFFVMFDGFPAMRAFEYLMLPVRTHFLQETGCDNTGWECKECYANKEDNAR